MIFIRRLSHPERMNTPLASPAVLLVIYCALVFVASLAGGWLPTLVRLTHTRLQVAVSFVAGLMLGLALLGLLPHAMHTLHSLERTLVWLLAGFLVMFFLQRFMHFHHHDVPEETAAPAVAHVETLAEHSARHLTWAGVAIGLSLHSVFDGLALAAAVESAGQGHGEALGLGTALAVMLHKPFGALAIVTLMAASQTPRSWRHWVNAGFALITPLGALLFFLGASHLAQGHPDTLGCALAFCAGTFLCIACADLLPEVQFHAHDRLKLSIALLAGLAAAVLINRFGHVGHEHDHHGAPPPAPPSPGGQAAPDGSHRPPNEGPQEWRMASTPMIRACLHLPWLSPLATISAASMSPMSRPSARRRSQDRDRTDNNKTKTTKSDRE